MKIASSVIVAAALVLASAPAFAHGMGGMGGNMGSHFSGTMGTNMGSNTGGNGNTGGNMGMGHGNGMTVTTHTHDWRINVTKFDKNPTKTKNFFRRIEFVRIHREILRLDRVIFRLIKLGKGNSPLVKGLEFQRAKLLQEQHV